jgi:hypothetical protein
LRLRKTGAAAAVRGFRIICADQGNGGPGEQRARFPVRGRGTRTSTSTTVGGPRYPWVFSAVRPSGTLISLIETEFLTRQVGRQVRGRNPSGAWIFDLRLRRRTTRSQRIEKWSLKIWNLKLAEPLTLLKVLHCYNPRRYWSKLRFEVQHVAPTRRYNRGQLSDVDSLTRHRCRPPLQRASRKF